MKKLMPEDLYTLERYARERDRLRSRVMVHKRARRLALGRFINLYFEDRLTMLYQVQEMLRAERIFEPEGIQEELDAYNPLIPDGTNWKATMMIEVPDPAERRDRLRELVGVENRVYMQVQGCERSYALADEDLERSNEEKTSAVHFLRFELSAAMIEALRNGAAVGGGIQHENYDHHVDAVDEAVRNSLLADLAI